jgi:hypothetical protein
MLPLQNMPVIPSGHYSRAAFILILFFMTLKRCLASGRTSFFDEASLYFCFNPKNVVKEQMALAGNVHHPDILLLLRCLIIRAN